MSPLAFRRREFLTLASSAALLGAGCASTPPSGRTRVARTSTGPLEGVREQGVNAFKGIRYAAAPLGDLRFKAPQEIKQSKATLDAVSFGAPAVQMYSRPDGEPRSPLGRTLLEVFPTGHETRAGNEDCLFLNVWTQGVHDGKRRPIMVWLHGGGMVYGSGSWPAFHGYNLAAKHDVVVVSVNHRLNAFGYLDLQGAMGDAFIDSCNAGHLDLIAALRWVQENAGAFGGNADNVTIFGQSGGGGKVSALMATPAAKGLFHKTIVQSGSGLRARTKEAAASTTDLVLAELGVAKGDTAKLMALPAETIRMALYAAEEKGRVSFGSTVDGRTLVHHPFDPDAPGQSKNIPMLIGTNKDEVALFQGSQSWMNKLTEAEAQKFAAELPGGKGPALLAAIKKDDPTDSPTFWWIGVQGAQQFLNNAIRQAERKVQQAGAPVYMYRMDWGTPIGGTVYRAGHSVETPLMFDTVEANRALLGPGPAPQAVATQMSSAWAAFARTGSPNTPVLPDWPKYDVTTRSTMIFNVESKMVNDPFPSVRAVLQS